MIARYDQDGLEQHDGEFVEYEKYRELVKKLEETISLYKELKNMVFSITQKAIG